MIGVDEVIGDQGVFGARHLRNICGNQIRQLPGILPCGPVITLDDIDEPVGAVLRDFIVGEISKENGAGGQTKDQHFMKITLGTLFSVFFIYGFWQPPENDQENQDSRDGALV